MSPEAIEKRLTTIESKLGRIEADEWKEAVDGWLRALPEMDERLGLPALVSSALHPLQLEILETAIAIARRGLWSVRVAQTQPDAKEVARWRRLRNVDLGGTPAGATGWAFSYVLQLVDACRDEVARGGHVENARGMTPVDEFEEVLCHEFGDAFVAGRDKPQLEKMFSQFGKYNTSLTAIATRVVWRAYQRSLILKRAASFFAFPIGEHTTRRKLAKRFLNVANGSYPKK